MSTYNDERRRNHDRDVETTQYDEANRTMEASSFACVRILNETISIATDTTEELERQNDALDRAERRLDEMDVDLEASKRNMREVKSVFGSFVNLFTKPNFDKGSVTSKPEKGIFPKPAEPPKVKTQAQMSKSSTGNEVVDRNLDEIECALKQLEGQANLIGHQLDGSNSQIDRIRGKMDDRQSEIKAITRDAKKQLYK